MIAGDTFLIPAVDDHLWVVLSNPRLDSDRVVLVCFLSWQPHHDQACLLYAGDHPFVRHTTCVNCPDARIETEELLDRLRSDGRVKMKEPASQALLVKIQTSAADGNIPTEAFEVLREQGLIG